jgi:DNA invertase Pin-like site-specific DNA recombinase
MQLSTCLEYAKTHGYEVNEVYTDIISGAKDNRPDFTRLLASTAKIDAVIVYEDSRIAREVELYYYYSKLLRNKGTEIISCKQSEDYSRYGDMAIVVQSMQASLSQVERKKIAQRTMDGKAAKARSGNGFKITGRANFGYKSIGRGELIVDEAEAEIVRKIFEMHRAGASLRTIAKAFEMPHSTINRIIKNEKFYTTGEFEYMGKKIQGTHTLFLGKQFEGAEA